MGKCTPTTYGHECCLHNIVWMNAHPWCTAMNVAFTTESGWMHTHDVRPRMFPSQQSLSECTLMMYGLECCPHNRVWVNAHPWSMATNVAFTTESGLMHTTTYGHRCCLSNRVWVNAHPQNMAMDVAFIKSKGVCTPTTCSSWVLRRHTAKVKMSQLADGTILTLDGF